jgi:hypothetical protein
MKKYLILILLLMAHNLQAAEAQLDTASSSGSAPCIMVPLFGEPLDSEGEVAPEESPLAGDPTAKNIARLVLENADFKKIEKLLRPYQVHEWKENLIRAASPSNAPLAAIAARHNNLEMLKYLAEIFPAGPKRNLFLLAKDLFDDDRTAYFWALAHDNNEILAYIQEAITEEHLHVFAECYASSLEKLESYSPESPLHRKRTPEEQAEIEAFFTQREAEERALEEERIKRVRERRRWNTLPEKLREKEQARLNSFRQKRTPSPVAAAAPGPLDSENPERMTPSQIRRTKKSARRRAQTLSGGASASAAPRKRADTYC